MRPANAYFHSGAALPLVLWAVFVMSTTLIVVISIVDFDLDLEGLAARRFEARQLALTGIAYASHPKVKRGDPLLFQTNPDGTRLEVLILNEDARLNINQMLAKGDASALERLFRYWGANEKETTMAIDSLKDWTDADEFRSLNGAEASDLQNQSDYSRPENRPFIRASEMAMVKGMDVITRIKPDWADYFSVKSSGRLDLQDVSSDLLQVLGGLNPGQAEAFIAFRNGPDGNPATIDDPEIKGVEALMSVVPLSESQVASFKKYFGSGGGIKRIVSRGHCGGLAQEITAVRAGSGGEQGGYLEWVER